VYLSPRVHARPTQGANLFISPIHWTHKRSEAVYLSHCETTVILTFWVNQPGQFITRLTDWVQLLMDNARLYYSSRKRDWTGYVLGCDTWKDWMMIYYDE